MFATPSQRVRGTPQHPSLLEQHIALAVVVWIIVAGVLVVAANAWAMGMM